MVSSRSRKKKAPRKPSEFVHKPRGVIHSRVQAVGPEHFGLVCVDCAKLRSKWMLADFYGRILMPPTEVAHNRVELDDLIQRVRAGVAQFDLRDCLVAIERTGRYHHPIKNAFATGGFDTRIVHPFATKQLRQPANPDDKTDDHDLAAIHRAAVNGFALTEQVPAESWRELQLLIRHRRSLVRKASALCCQIREHLDAVLPGYAACFENFWDSTVALPLVRHFDTAQAMLEAGVTGLSQFLRGQGVRCHRATLDTILVWAKSAAPADLAANRPSRHCPSLRR
jgi:hypothetical protein